MARVTPSNEKPRQRLGNRYCLGLGSVAVKMSQRGPHPTAVIDGSGELTGSPPRLRS